MRYWMCGYEYIALQIRVLVPNTKCVDLTASSASYLLCFLTCGFISELLAAFNSLSFCSSLFFCSALIRCEARPGAIPSILLALGGSVSAFGTLSGSKSTNKFSACRKQKRVAHHSQPCPSCLSLFASAISARLVQPCGPSLCSSPAGRSVGRHLGWPKNHDSHPCRWWNRSGFRSLPDEAGRAAILHLCGGDGPCF
ncbi:hypothetical protein B0H11DRAFT_1946610 [Mycena galericulata]|nr:hypothetical protein B0H11DRAFT_1946610 [Mycena galericulata]